MHRMYNAPICGRFHAHILYQKLIFQTVQDKLWSHTCIYIYIYLCVDKIIHCVDFTWVLHSSCVYIKAIAMQTVCTYLPIGWLIKYILMERTTTVTGDVPKFSGKLVLQATDQHAGGKFDELVLPQRGVSFERLNNIMNLSPVRLHACFLRALYVLNLFYYILCESAMQNRERAIDLAPSMNVGAATACDTMEGRVELVVPCGKAYFESEESLSYFLSKPVSYCVAAK